MGLPGDLVERLRNMLAYLSAIETVLRMEVAHDLAKARIHETDIKVERIVVTA